jgi:hypothetical protein
MICSDVKISVSGLSQLKGNDIVSTVPKDDIVNITLCYDSRSTRPFLRFSAGFILIAVGLVFLTTAFLMAEGGVYNLELQVFTLGVPLIPIALWLLVGFGLWLILGVFPGRYNLLIKTRRGSRKIFFRQSADIREIRSFVGRAVGELGYTIDVSLLNTMLLDSGDKTCRCI